MSVTRRIVALGGGGFTQEPDNPLLDTYVLGLTGKRRPKVTFVPTASGDSPQYIASFGEAFGDLAEATYLSLYHRTVDDLLSFLLAHDIVYVGGGNTANQLAIWRAHSLDRALRAAWRQGVILSGVSAGALCWFDGGVTDSYGPSLAPLRGGGLKLIRASFAPHYSAEPQRRPAFQQYVRESHLDGFAADDGVALHFEGRRLVEAVSSRPTAGAYRVSRTRKGVSETAIAVRYLGRPSPSERVS